MGKNCLTVILFFIIILVFAIGISARQKVTAKKRLAVIKIFGPESELALARLTRNKIELNLFKTGSFDILERDQIDFVMKEKNIKPESLTDDNQAVKLGELISADYIVLGRIEKEEQYILTIRIVEVKGNRIMASDTDKFDLPENADPVISRLVKKIEQKILNLGTVKEDLAFKRDFYFLAGYLFLSPQGRFKDLMGSGYGISASAGLNSVFINSLRLGVNLNLFNFDGDGTNTDKARMLPVMLEAGYVINFSSIFFVPLLSAGGSYNTNYQFKYTTGSETEKKSSLQFMTNAGICAGYALNDFLLIQADFKSWQIYEEAGTSMFWGAGFSAGLQF